MTKYLPHLLILTIALAVFFRFWQFGQVPSGSYWDETAMLIDAKAFVTTGLDQHGLSVWTAILPSYGDYKLAVYPVLVFLLAQALGPELWVVRLPSLLTGLLSIGVTYLLARRLAELTGGSKQAGLFGLSAGLIIATSPWSFVFSRTGFESHLAQFWLAGAVYLTLSPIRLWLKLPLILFFGVLSMLTYYALGFVWPVVIIAGLMASYLWTRSKTQHDMGLSISRASLSIVMVILVALISYLAFTSHRLYPQFNQYRLSTASILNTTDYPILSNQLRQWAGNHSYDRVFFHRHYLLLLALADNLSRQLSPTTLFFTADSNLRHSVTHTGLFLWPGIFLLIIGCLNLLKKQKIVLLFLLIWILVAVIPASVPVVGPHALRSLPALVPLSLLIGWGLATLLTQNYKVRAFTLLQYLFLTGYLATFLIFVYTYFVSYPTISREFWQTSYKSLVEQVVQLRTSGQKTLIIHPDGLLYLWFMAYGPYSGQEFSQWTQTNYQLTQFDNIYFRPSLISPDELTQLNILAGNKEMINNFLDQNLNRTDWNCLPIDDSGPEVNISCQKVK